MATTVTTTYRSPRQTTYRVQLDGRTYGAIQYRGRTDGRPERLAFRVGIDDHAGAPLKIGGKLFRAVWEAIDR